jgi:hypothetical protein
VGLVATTRALAAPATTTYQVFRAAALDADGRHVTEEPNRG